MQGHAVDVASGPADAARLALASPPSVIVADLWMPKISGVQLALLLRSEAATENVPVILRGDDEPAHRFWAERAGAADYVVRGRTVDLVRALDRIVAPACGDAAFFTQFDGATDIRDRIAAHLDAALLHAAIASEVRSLSSAHTFERLFDRLCQFLSRLTSYRWLALSCGPSGSSRPPGRFAVHTTPSTRGIAEQEARALLGVPDGAALFVIEDADPIDSEVGPSPISREIVLDGQRLGTLIIAPAEGKRMDVDHFEVVARELASPLRLTLLLEETERLATIDPLTGVMNRRAFEAALTIEIARASRLGYSVALVVADIDHFKVINDRHGHGTGDKVLCAVAKSLKYGVRNVDIVARWGGEEFLVALCGTTPEGALIAAERLRKSLEALEPTPSDGLNVVVSASFGVAMLTDTFAETFERADSALYRAKESGRNRVEMFTSNAASGVVEPSRVSLFANHGGESCARPSMQS